MREEKLLLGLKLAAATLLLVMLAVGLILKLHNCKRNFISTTGGQNDVGIDGVTNSSQVNIQLPALNIV